MLDLMNTLSPWRRNAIVATMLLLLSFAAYGINLNGPLIWDDPVWITNNPAVTHWHPGWIWIHQDSSPSYYPLTVTSFWMEYHLWGASPIGYRIINILLHSASAYLLWRLLKELKIPGALLAAMIWAVHPIQVETVVWITERKNTLSGVFFFASLLLWLRMIAEPAMHRREWKLYAGALGLFLLALLSKTATVFLPVAALAIVLLNYGRISRRQGLLSLPFFALAAIMGLVTVLVEHHVAATGYGAAWELDFAQRFILSGRVFWFYPMKILWPVDLVAVYPKWELHAANPLEYLWPISALLLIAALIATALRWKKFGPMCAVVVYLAGIFPVIGYMKFFTQLYTYVADHYVYLPSAALIMLAAAAIALLWRKIRQALPRMPDPLAPIACGALAVALVILSAVNAAVYRDSYAIWEKVLRVNPNAFVAQTNLGVYHHRAGNNGKALEYFEKSLSLYRDKRVLGYAGLLLEARGQVDRARNYYQEAVQARIDVPDVYKQLAKMEMAAGRPDRAIEVCKAGLAVSAEWPTLWFGLGMIYRQTQQHDKALDAFDHYLKLRPNGADAYMEMGTIHLDRGEVDKAIASFRNGKRANPEYLPIRRMLASTLWNSGKTAEATQEIAAADQLEASLKEKAAKTKPSPVGGSLPPQSK